jgi:hypothetical protein
MGYQEASTAFTQLPDSWCGTRDTLSKKDIDRYEEQLRQIQKILAIYEESPDDYIQLFSALQQVHSDILKLTCRDRLESVSLQREGPS